MFKKLAVIACVGLIVAACKRQPTTNVTEAPTPTSSASSAQATQSAGRPRATDAMGTLKMTTALGMLKMAAPAGMAIVEIHVQGVCGIVDQQNATNFPATSKTVIIPTVSSSSTIPLHTPFIAWRKGNETTAPSVVADWSDPLDNTSWRVHVLTRQEIVLPDLSKTNPPVMVTPDKCDPHFDQQIAPATFDCFPPLSGFVDAANSALEPNHLLRVKPSSDIAGRMELAYGALAAFAGDRNEWVVFKDGSDTPSNPMYMANDLVYVFAYPEKTPLVLQTRTLDDDPATPGTVTDLLTLTTPSAGNTMRLRLGNLIINNKMFPNSPDLHGFDDLHFAAYYVFFKATTAAGAPVPHRTTKGVPPLGDFTPDVYCGPGYVK